MSSCVVAGSRRSDGGLLGDSTDGADPMGLTTLLTPNGSGLGRFTIFSFVSAGRRMPRMAAVPVSDDEDVAKSPAAAAA